jgi:predicted DNA-binding transcriptional regulator AlpA
MNAQLPPPSLDRLLHPTETARLLGVSLSWLAKSRLRGDGPRYRKIGRSVRYAESDIRDYLKAHSRASTSEDRARKRLPTG